MIDITLKNHKQKPLLRDTDNFLESKGSRAEAACHRYCQRESIKLASHTTSSVLKP
ncbi:hypothetical protein M758_11G044200 [Ceratodon purpureus]|nr:hypothetical protein M758_11G044200 [Ceratodon purpureus]